MFIIKPSHTSTLLRVSTHSIYFYKLYRKLLWEPQFAHLSSLSDVYVLNGSSREIFY